MDSKKALEQLVKIAENHQKIINQLVKKSQNVSSTGWVEVKNALTKELMNLTKSHPNSAWGVSSARVNPLNGELEALFAMPKGLAPQVTENIKNQLNKDLIGNVITSDNGKQVKVLTTRFDWATLG